MYINERIQFLIDFEVFKMKMKKKIIVKIKVVIKFSYRVVVYKVINFFCKL